MLGQEETLKKFASIIQNAGEFWKYASEYHFVSGASGKPYPFIGQCLIGSQLTTNEGVFLTENQLINRDMDLYDKPFAFSMYPAKVYEEKLHKDLTGKPYIEQHNEWEGFYVYLIRNEVAKHKINSSEFYYYKHRNMLEKLLDQRLDDTNTSCSYFLAKNIALSQLKSIFDYPIGDWSDYWMVNMDSFKELSAEQLITCFNRAEEAVTKIALGNRKHLPKGQNSIYEFATGVKPEFYEANGKEWIAV